MNLRKELMEWIKCIVVSVIIALVIRTFIFNSTKVIGSSMYPTLHENDRLFSMKIVYLLGEPKREDIVVIQAPDDPSKDYIKRVIGVAGDKVEIKDGNVYVNGEKKEEKYIAEGSFTEVYNENSWEVPEGYIFVLGDNREPGASKDSRSFGIVETDSVKGKASYRYFPFDRFGSL
ncbi:signal peptidase I [Gottschalkia acidurici 9a]|uniref:Signal peptidase I n=1 Tax=Gottschalkia acidurici (strain ATCC 7906 / DSM 604 / BCRC 14475 / CIP 104303 / KCTC 5404 / NCIMB 10678 / 9a) TaxID=1128398 RepID=K0B1L4_GOTA9|nr:signal peptidase I [Gottschalkia acidurici]AFS78840.1 signal peptidase I [Gottschalkia acidurici 9a]